MAADLAGQVTHEKQSFLRHYIFSTDHKIIGIQYFLTAMFMALVGGFLAMLIRLNLAWPGEKWAILGMLFPSGAEDGILKPEFYMALVTMHGTIMVFFVVSFALVSGFGNFLIPLQIGARDMAFPFLNMLSYWVAVPACIIMLLSFLVEGGAAASGWTAYPPLSAVREVVIPGSIWGQTLWLLAMALFIVSFTMGGLNFIVTVLNLRAPGMSMRRLPLTVWSLFMASIIGVISFPALTAAAVLLLFDRHLGTSFYLPAGLFFGNEVLPNEGGTPLLWQHLFWFLGHPEVYVLILPALGITFDILPAFTRKPIFGYGITTVSLYIIAGLSMVVWGHHMFVSGMNPFVGEFFSIGTLLITVPSAMIGVNMIGSLWGGSLRLTTAMLFTLGLISLFGTGGMGGLFLGNAAADVPLHDTYFVVGHFHLMIGGVTLFGMLAGTYFWFPKMFGRMMNEKLGKLHFWLTLPAFYFIFLSQHFLGLGGMPRRYYSFASFNYLEEIRDINIFITLATFVLGVGQAVFLINFFWSLAKGAKAGENPWKATTLEWTTPSPPPHGNWGEVMPTVHRWPYEYGLEGASQDYIPQDAPADAGRVETPGEGEYAHATHAE
ncbi:cbb3-type cytochrome c oxidase subunit I [Acidobacteria bacterium AH-259-D05]|nr:cbb3-type cytochrome c oxidase subunit I [Acidobacteria bacterium AH-259-D05]